MSKVAVWINNFGNAKHLAKCIESVLAQTYEDFTLFIFDNHSPAPVQEIIRHYASKQELGVINMEPLTPKGLAGIPHMDFAWNYLSKKLEYDYSITLGGHDLWPNDKHLEVLVKRADAERGIGREFAVIACDTWQMNEEGNICGRFQNYFQEAGQTPTPFVPQLVVSSVDSPQVFGLWNEKIRKKVPIRHLCAGWDHLVVMHAALYGAILYEGSTGFLMRAPPPGDGLHKYATRHFDAKAQQGKEKDFMDQLEWILHCVDKACEGAVDFNRAMLSVSMFTMYLCRRGYNLAVFEGGVDAFNARPDVQRALGACLEAYKRIQMLVTPVTPRP